LDLASKSGLRRERLRELRPSAYLQPATDPHLENGSWWWGNGCPSRMRLRLPVTFFRCTCRKEGVRRSQKMKRTRLEKNGALTRHSFNEIPTKVEYTQAHSGGRGPFGGDPLPDEAVGRWSWI